MLQTPLHSWHANHHGRLVDFAGWEMPVQYTSIIAEHEATRNAVTLFDVSHMGRFQFRGGEVPQFLDRLTTRRVSDLSAGRIRYSLLCNESGGILDDVLVYHLAMDESDPEMSMVVNAGNRDKISRWIRTHLAKATGIEFTDLTLETGMIAVQGPRAVELTARLADVDPASLAYFTGVRGRVAGHPALISRTGYTGEDGCELIVAASAAEAIWQELATLGREMGLQPAGLGARDTLRLEAAMPLYGHELSESINPAQTGLGFAITLKDRQFIGRDAIVAAQNDDRLPVRVGFEMDGKRAAREEAEIFRGDQPVGRVTSGTFSPTLKRPIGMAYVRRGDSAVGTELEIDIRGKRHPARIVGLPFYSRK